MWQRTDRNKDFIENVVNYSLSLLPPVSGLTPSKTSSIGRTQGLVRHLTSTLLSGGMLSHRKLFSSHGIIDMGVKVEEHHYVMRDPGQAERLQRMKTTSCTGSLVMS